MNKKVHPAVFRRSHIPAHELREDHYSNKTLLLAVAVGLMVFVSCL